MINPYYDVQTYKEQVNSFLALVTNRFGENRIGNCQSSMVYITRLFLFLKDMYSKDNESEGYFMRCWASNMLFSIHAIFGNYEKLFYYEYRSMIENSLRVILQKPSDDETGIRKLFDEASVLCDTKEKHMIYEFMLSDYAKCCDIVHCNNSASINVFEYYQDILNNEEMTSDKRVKCFSTLSTFFKKIIEIVVRTNIDDISTKYYRKSKLLEFLLGKELYDLYNGAFKDKS